MLIKQVFLDWLKQKPENNMAHRFSRSFIYRFFLPAMVVVLTACMPVAQPLISPVSPTATLPAVEPRRVVEGRPAESYMRISWSPDC
jgi:hypothetical protein